MTQTSNTAWADWIGRTESNADTAAAAPVAALAATLNREDPIASGILPPLWHWLYFLPVTAQDSLGADGHPKRGGFLPPVALPRRMWAGGRLIFQRPLAVGGAIRRHSSIQNVQTRDGRSGSLVFVTAKHDISDAQGLALIEEQDIVYREAPRPGEPAPVPRAAPTDAAFSRDVVPDPVLLFRYSALTFNGHRIHYDRPYATGQEGYPGLVVHGPLIATLLLELLHREMPAARVLEFEFKAVSALFDTAPFRLCGRGDGPGRYSLWAEGSDGRLAMQASARIAKKAS